MKVSYLIALMVAVLAGTAFRSLGGAMALSVAGDVDGAAPSAARASVSSQAGVLELAAEYSRRTRAAINAGFDAAREVRQSSSATSSLEAEALAAIRPTLDVVADGFNAVRRDDPALANIDTFRKTVDVPVRSRVVPWLARNAKLPFVDESVRWYVDRHIQSLLVKAPEENGEVISLLVDVLTDGFMAASPEARERILASVWRGGVDDEVAVDALRELGPGYVKLGQILSADQSFLDDAVRARLKPLREHLPPMPFEDFQRIVTDSFARTGTDLSLDALETEPLGVGSVGETHRAVVNGNTRVIKALAPGAGEHLMANFDTMAASLRGRGAYGDALAMIVEQLKSLSVQEIDLRLEAQAQRRFGRGRWGRDRVPRVDYADEDVLIMTEAEGVPLAKDALDGPQRERAARSLMVDTLRSIIMGEVHGDLHAGNIRHNPVSQKNVYMDWGLTGRMKAPERVKLARLYRAVVKHDTGRVVRALRRLAEEETEAATLEEVVAHAFEEGGNSSTIMGRVMIDAKKAGINTPEGAAVTAKTLRQAADAVRELIPDFDLVKALKGRAVEIVKGIPLRIRDALLRAWRALYRRDAGRGALRWRPAAA